MRKQNRSPPPLVLHFGLEWGEGYTRLVTEARTIERTEANGAASALYPYLARNA